MKSTEEQEEPGQAGTSKILSICIAGRDDDYMPDFRYRVTTTINHIARSLKQLGRLNDVEILIIDWGSHIPMAHTLDLSPEAAGITRFIYVPPELIRATQDGREDFHSSRAPNVAIRRASGTYILVYPGDTLIPRYALESLLRLLNGEIPMSIELDRTYFLLPRLDVPWQFLERRPSLEEWERYFLVSNKKIPLEPPDFCFFGGAGALLMHRSMWYELRGFDEQLAGWGWNDIDLGFRVSQCYSFLSLSSFGIILYHMGHPPKGRRQLALQKQNSRYYNCNHQVNDENWGFGDIVNLEIHNPQKKYNGAQNSCYVKTVIDSTESWNQSIADLTLQLKNSSIYEKVKSVYISFLKRGWKIKLEDLNAFFLLSWNSSNHFPRRYLEFTVGRSPASGIVAAGCPSVDIYKVDKWQGVSPPHTPLDLSFINENLSYCGYLRFINGDIGTAIQRLRDSFIGPISFDLVFIKDELLGDDILKTIYTLLPYLTHGGALVFFRNSRSSFESDWSELQKKYPEYTYISCADHQTGMILNKSFDDVKNKYSRIEEVSFSTSWVIPAKIKGQIIYIIIKIISNRSINKVFRKLIGNMR